MAKALSRKKPSQAASEVESPTRTGVERLSQGRGRVYADVSLQAHREVKRRALKEGLSMQQWVIQLLQKEGIPE